MDMGVNVYRIPRSRGQCPMYYALPEVPSNLRAVWDEIAGGSGQGQLAGAYFEICEGVLQTATNCRQLPEGSQNRLSESAERDLNGRAVAERAVRSGAIVRSLCDG